MTLDLSRFEDLLRLWQDDEASASDLEELSHLLRREPVLRRELVLATLLDVHLYRRYASQAPARRTPRWRPLEAAAALVVVAVSAFLLGRLFLRHDEPKDRVASGEVWSDGARASTLLEGHSFDVRGTAAASLHLRDGSLVVLAPGSAGTLGTGGGMELSRGSGSFSFHGPHRLSTPSGTLTAAQAEFQVLLRKLPRELVVEVSRGSAEIDSFGRRETLAGPQRRTFGPPPHPGDIDYSRLFDGASFGLLEAIDRATALAPGIPLKAALESEDGRPVFSVSIAQDGHVREIDLDVRTGKVVGDDADDEDHARLLAALRIPLKEAIAKATEFLPGRAVEVEAELKAGHARIDVKILGDEGVRKVQVDGETGQVRSDKN